MYSEVISTVKTKQDLEHLVGEVEKLKESIYESKTDNFESALKKHVRKSIASLLRRDLESEEISKAEYLDTLDKKLASLETVKITVAFEPTEEFVDYIFAWIGKNVGKAMVIHFVTNRSILGGAIIEYKGKYHSYSLNKTLDELFQQESEGFIDKLTKAS